MDYTTLTEVKTAMDAQDAAAAGAILPDFITKASRYLDVLCTSQPGLSDYFTQETITDEVLTNGRIDFAGRLWVYPHKPTIKNVASLQYRYSMAESYKDADLTRIALFPETILYEGGLPPAIDEMIYVKVSYTGGYATTTAGLPRDFVHLATIMTVRLFKEVRSGLGDSIGVAELGTMIYTKAFPQQVIDMLNVAQYARIAPWT
jgi:hypothetical protein